MPDIHVLDQNTINQIAAGEVIERPASVVKELLENAIDAKASAVTVEIKEGGIGFIRITDNGCGIEKKDVKIAFLRHSTSKIMSAEDLVTVSSLGFRGEALSSIAAVGQVELITKTKGELTGVRYVIEGGEEKALEEVGVPDGTTFIVRNLFFNTPARRKFLKSAVTEAGYISDIVERIALSHPEVSVRFIVNGQNKLHTSGNGNLKDVIYGVFGRDIAANLLEINQENEFMKISGFIGKPIISRGNRNYENYFINGRYIRSSLISKAIEEAYKPFMMQHKYPFTALHISIDGSLLDVNVHPTKMELRFRNQEQIYPYILKLIGDTLLGKELIPESVCDDEKTEKAKINNELKEQKKQVAYKPLAEPFEVNRRSEQIEKKVENKPIDNKSNAFSRPAFSKPIINRDTKPITNNDINIKTEDKHKTQLEADNKSTEVFVENKVNIVASNDNLIKDNDDFITNYKNASNNNENENTEIETKANDIKPEQLTLFEEKLLTKEAREKHILVGQVFDTYWIVQFGDKMFIIDQHAAHEKVLYERTLAKYRERKAISQSINPPIILTLSMSEEAMLKQYMDIFTDFGYEIEHFGGKEYCVRAVPYDLYSISKEDLLMEILDNLSEETGGKITPQLITEKIASMSCKAAVKGNNRLSEAEVNKLIDELLTLENPYNCPHGRPTIISMSKYELEKKFKRVL
ncbi:MAG: DNA mismatch repair endonuclease MutL [Lachnospiraceae bacterium]|nr:DNA mismatch repair endonuclease MutL [Lachnospiraceae bacterium]